MQTEPSSAQSTAILDMPSFVEKHFGSDKALGVSFVNDSTEEPYTLEQADELFRTLGDKAPGMYSVFEDGSSAITCTNYAVQVGYVFKERSKIMGFANENNPESLVAIEEIHPSGHDFAVVDDRWLIDPWVRIVATAYDRICFDMANPDDMAIVKHIYGDPSCWERLESTEASYLLKDRKNIEIPPVQPAWSPPPIAPAAIEGKPAPVAAPAPAPSF